MMCIRDIILKYGSKFGKSQPEHFLSFYYALRQNMTFMLWNNSHENNKVVYFTCENDFAYMFHYHPCFVLFLDIPDLITSLVKKRYTMGGKG